MRYAKPEIRARGLVDAVADPDDEEFEVEVLKNATGWVIYIHVDSVTMVRIGHIKERPSISQQVV